MRRCWGGEGESPRSGCMPAPYMEQDEEKRTTRGCGRTGHLCVTSKSLLAFSFIRTEETPTFPGGYNPYPTVEPLQMHLTKHISGFYYSEITFLKSFFALFIVYSIKLNLMLHSCNAHAGHSLPMPPQLMELYSLYQLELETRENNERDAQLVTNAEKILRVT
jgi:hypothetical protein